MTAHYSRYYNNKDINMLLQHIKDAQLITSIFNIYKEGSACIAGGYLRDVYIGREPKDIDILVQYESDADYKEVEILADRLGYDLKDYSDQYGSVDTEGQLRNVFTLMKYDKPCIDIIFLNCTVQERIENFPCSISKIWLDGSKLVLHKEFEETIDIQTMTFRSDVTPEYEARLRGYFPQYKVKYE